ncbi:MAG: hypothetical protein NT105_04580 [Verrucomicrobia bacterium]|nr:hypothetical protein [Verrucomicrobiota bacterium]
MNAQEKIARLENFKKLVRDWDSDAPTPSRREEIRSQISQEKVWVRQQVIEARCFSTLTIGPPPAIGGLIMKNLDPFAMIFERPYLQNLIPPVLDMVDQTIGVLRAEPEDAPSARTTPVLRQEIISNYAFIAMPMDENDHDLIDVLDAIKEGARRCGIQAERVDEPDSNERITDRIIESIQKAEFVIVDLTDQRPNVYWEAGFAHASGKTPVYIARHETKIEFDIKDYPVIFFKSLKQLKDDLEKRLRGISSSK